MPVRPNVIQVSFDYFFERNWNCWTLQISAKCILFRESKRKIRHECSLVNVLTRHNFESDVSIVKSHVDVVEEECKGPATSPSADGVGLDHCVNHVHACLCLVVVEDHLWRLHPQNSLRLLWPVDTFVQRWTAELKVWPGHQRGR